MRRRGDIRRADAQIDDRLSLRQLFLLHLCQHGEHTLAKPVHSICKFHLVLSFLERNLRFSFLFYFYFYLYESSLKL